MTITSIPGGGVVFAGAAAVDVYRAIACANGLEMWARAKIRPNRAWTPKAMMRLASALTGEAFSPRDYLGAAKALRRYAERAKR